MREFHLFTPTWDHSAYIVLLAKKRKAKLSLCELTAVREKVLGAASY
jgi:hypothetical protein